MAQRVIADCVASLGLFQQLKIQFLSVFVGLYIIFKKAVISLWKSSVSLPESRYAPLPCLVDNTIGQHSYIKLKDVKLHYVEAGDRKLPLALLLHGFPDCWLGWRHQISVLSQHFRVVVVDLKGFGDSDKPVWRGGYKVKNILRELKQFVHSLGAQRCVIIGHDLGAHLAWYFVTQYPDMVDKFVAVSSAHPNIAWENLPANSLFNHRWVQFCQLPWLPEREAYQDDISLIDQCLSHLRNTKEEKLVAAYKYTFSRHEDWVGPINYWRNLPLTRISEGMYVEVPTLLITGNKDAFLLLESVVRSTEFVGKFVLKIVDGAGHFPHQECPEQFNRLLLSFLTVSAPSVPIDKTEPTKGIIGSLYSNTVKYGNTIVDNMKKTTNVVWMPSHMLKHPS